MEQVRKPGQGVWNIIRFNWHFYAAAAGAIVLLLLLAHFLEVFPVAYLHALMWLITGTTVVSLLVSFYVYDVSGLYSFTWLDTKPEGPTSIVNIHAGFDETSVLLASQFASQSGVTVLDFYDPAVHTEVSIRRARAAYLPFPGTQPARTHQLPLPSSSVEWIFIILAAHEIRQPAERIAFFQEIRRVVAPTGKIVVVEHLRDIANFMAYTVGFLHFYSHRSWLSVFKSAGLALEQEKKITPFVSAFILSNHADAA